MPQVTLSTLETRVWDRLENNTLLYPAVDVDAKINEALKITNLFAGWNQARVPLALSVANRSIYILPDGVLFPTKLYVENQEISKETLWNITALKPNWLQGQGTKIQYWMPLGVQMLAVYPTDKRGGSYMEIWGVIEPDTLVNPNDSSNLPDEYQDLVIDYAFMNLVLKESGVIFTSASKLYKPWLKKMESLQMWQSRVNPAFIVEVKQAA